MSLDYVTPTIEPYPIHFMSPAQMQAEKGNEILFDIETYPNFFLIGMKSYQTGFVKFFESSAEQDMDYNGLRWMVHNCTLIGFNLTGYDLPMLWAVLAGRNCGQLYEISRKLTEKRKNQYGKRIKPKPWLIAKNFGFKIGRCDAIDIQVVAPALPQELSLKHYGARMHVDRLQELPVDFTADLSYEQARGIRLYNINDLDVTGWLRHALTADLELRKQMSQTYGIDLRSRSDAQIAERVMAAEIKSQTGIEISAAQAQERWKAGTKFKYKNPSYIQFYTPKLQELHKTLIDQIFVVTESGKVKTEYMAQYDGKNAVDIAYHDELSWQGILDEKSKWSVKVGDTTYTIGIGGLHSTEKSQTYFTDDRYQLFDRDVASYYPAIILNQGLFPQHIGPAFLEVYQEIVTRRLEAKAAGDKATSNSLKITINGGFGKLGSKWSIFYSPDLLIQVTITGQLSLLMLIEMLEMCQIPVVSANTDGIVIRCPQGRQADYLQVVADWERITGFETEEAKYASLHSRDVNNYIAITNSGEIKAKGAYTNKLSFKNPNREMLTSNPTAEIVSEAVMIYLKTCKTDKVITIDETITKCKDIRKFLFVKRVNGGAVHNGSYIGKVVRWYYQKRQYGDIRNANPNKAGKRPIVGDSQGAMPLMDLPKKFPKDINYSKYIQRAKSDLEDLGYGAQLELF